MTEAMQMPDLPANVDLEIECQVLGQMLQFGTYAEYLASGLRREFFFREFHQHVFDAIATVEAGGVAADIVSVGLLLRERRQIHDGKYYPRLIDGVVRFHAAGRAMFVGQLAELAGRRGVAAAIERGSLDDVTVALQRARESLEPRRRALNSAGQLQAVLDDSALDAQGRVFLSIPTLDNILEGFRAGEVVGLMARPGIGKTLVLCHLVRAIAGVSPFAHVFFSLEMPGPQIVDRIAASHYGLNRHTFRERLEGVGLDTDDYVTAFQRFVLVDEGGLSVAQMAARLRQVQGSLLRGQTIRVVTIDHLGLIGGDRKMTTYDRVSTQARELKEFAKTFNVTVILAVQVNREAGGDGSKELHLGSARDSGVVEEAMDYLIALRRLDRSQSLSLAEREKYRDVLFAKVVKNRHGAPDTEVAIRFDARTLTLWEDPDVKPEQDDLDRIAQQAGRRR